MDWCEDTMGWVVDWAGCETDIKFSLSISPNKKSNQETLAQCSTQERHP